jgi:putative transcriptional regulator
MTIKELRASTGLSQSKFALLVHVPVATIQTWEQGTRKPPEYILFLIEQYLKSLQK